MYFSNLPKKIFEKTILNLKFKFPTNNPLPLLAGNLNFKFRIVFWNIFFRTFGDLKKESHFLKKKPPLGHSYRLRFIHDQDCRQISIFLSLEIKNQDLEMARDFRYIFKEDKWLRNWNCICCSNTTPTEPKPQQVKKMFKMDQGTNH